MGGYLRGYGGGRTFFVASSSLRVISSHLSRNYVEGATDMWGEDATLLATHSWLMADGRVLATLP